MSTPTVLAAVDLSAPSDIALRQAHALAAATGSRLAVCHVLPQAFRVRVLFPHEAGLDEPMQTEMADKGRAAVRAHVASVIGETLADDRIALDSGAPHAGILEQAGRLRAALIVTGPGPTACRVARAARCPTLVARPLVKPGTVLGATDFSDPALPAVAEAHRQARLRAAPLRLVHCLDIDVTALMGSPLGTFYGQVAMPPFSEQVILEMEAEARTRLNAALSAVEASGEVEVSRLSPVAGILQAASDARAELIVVGTHGRTGLRKLVLGAVAEDVMNRAGCSVMVVPLARG